MNQNDSHNTAENATANAKMKKCASCGTDIAVKAKTCPHCGAKNKKPIYKRAWFIIVVIIAAIIIIASVAGGGSNDGAKGEAEKTQASGNVEVPKAESSQEKAEISYTAVTADEMMDALDANALSASDTYKNTYVELTGKLNNIDSDGKYISLVPVGREFAIIGVHCTLKSDEQKQAVRAMSIGDTITLKGKITDVGEVLGYYLDVDCFVQ